MCGFIQVIQKNKPINKIAFSKALQSLHHRGPDEDGIFYTDAKNQNSKNLYFAFGHKRLSILDLDKRSNQPFIQNEHILLYNGEIYNYKKLSKTIKNNDFSTTGDTEIVLKSLIEEKENALQKYNGMWALSLVDIKKLTCFLSRDRYGKKPLFYYLKNDIFCVSSSIKALQIYLSLSLEFTQKSLYEYMLYGLSYPSATNQTHFKDIYQILPSHYANFDLNKWQMKQEPYFNPFYQEKKEEFSLEKTLEKSVTDRLISDRPIALLLSGGVDSSFILSVLYHLNLHENITVFMADTGRSDDFIYAKKCADKLGIKAKNVICDYDKNTFNRFLNVCKHHEKPFPFNGNALAMPQMYEEVSKQNIPVVLDGSGGDEIFGGYWERHLPFIFKEFSENTIQDKEWLSQILKTNKNENHVQQLYKKSTKDYKYNKNIKLNLYHSANPFIKIPIKNIWSTKNPDPLNYVDCNLKIALCRDIANGGRLGDWIWHNDRNSMMYSVESRSPFLDKRLHRFIFDKYNEKYQKQWNKYKLRKAFDNFTPLPTQWRKQKQGFRWDGKHFFYNNKQEILNLIEKSDILDNVIHKKRFIKVANKYPKLLRSSIGKRALGIAGIEFSMINSN